MYKYFLIVTALVFACGQEQSEQGTENHAQGQMQNQPRPGMAQTAHGMPSWTAPEGWVEEQPSSNMRKAQFRLAKVAGDPEDASVVIFYFGGGGGGVQANIDRWTKQFKQPEGSDSELKETTVNGLKHTTVDVSGTFKFQKRPMSSPTIEKPGFRMIATVVETGTGPWFVKFVGPEATVKKWEESFHEFMASFEG